MDKKAAILNATLNLVTTRGLYDTPMAQVAKDAGVAAGTIYHYFENKEQLILELFVDAKTKMKDILAHKYNEVHSYQEQFALFWKNLFSFYIKNPLLFQFMEQFENSPFFQKADPEMIQESYQLVISFLEKGINENILRPLEVPMMISILNGSIASLAKMHLSGTLIMDSSRLYKAMEISWNGLKK